MSIIAISAKIGTGKTTLANIFQELEPNQWKIKNFADKLKNITSILAGVPIEDCYSQEGKNKFIDAFNMTLGEMLQKIGSETMRDGFDTDVWVKSLFVDYKKEWLYEYSGKEEKIYDEQDGSFIKSVKEKFGKMNYPNWIIGDARFINEVEYIKNMGGIIIRLEGDPASVRANSKRDLNHISETALDNYQGFDFIYQNNKSLDDLREFAKSVLCTINSNKHEVIK